MNVHLTMQSQNSKTGPIPVSTSSRDTCPTSCPWYKKGCYANGGPLKLHWDKVSNRDRGYRLSEFLNEIQSLPPGALWRHNQAGDLPGKDESISRTDLHNLSLASSHTKGFTYTHKMVLGSSSTAIKNRVLIARYNTPGFVINLSGNSLEHADQLYRLNIAPVTTVLPSTFAGRSFRTPAGVKGIVCPAITKEGVQCSSCAICAIPNRRYIVGFPSHGSQKRELDFRLSST